MPGRSADGATAWIRARSSRWRKQVRWGVMDLSGPYRKTFTEALAHARQVADPYRVIKLANSAVDDVRRRVPKRTTGGRGTKHDPLYRIRRLLLKASERVTDRGRHKLRGLLAAGDLRGEVRDAWHATETLRGVYRIPKRSVAVETLDELARGLQDETFSAELNKLGRTLAAWRTQITNRQRSRVTNDPLGRDHVEVSIRRTPPHRPYCGSMDTGNDGYFALSADGTWIDRLLVRLPYSFRQIEVKPGSGGKFFVVSDPVLREGEFSATFHNFWCRGHVFYQVGKLLDCYLMARIWQDYRMRVGLLRLKHPGDSDGSTAFGAFNFYNSMQLEKVWSLALGNHLDRERVIMTNLTQALELCLKALITHASYLESGQFKFPSGHRVADLYQALPPQLRDEFADESRVFADSYASYRAQIENDVRAIFDRHVDGLLDAQVVRDEREQWEYIASELNDSNYTAFVSSNDPGAKLDERRDVWFDDALGSIGKAHGFGDELQYYRYAPAEGTDDLPIDPINSTLLLGRFFYEHLFPMPRGSTTPVETQLHE